MADWITAQETLIRLPVFFVILLLMAVWEVTAPRRRRDIPRLIRWTNNFAIVIINAILVRLIFPATIMAFALVAEQREYGLLGLFQWPLWVKIPLAIVALDLAIYLQHVVFHAVPALWRLHRMHHADLEFDVTTGLRFHPVEIILSMAIKFAVVAAIGAPAVSVLLFEILLNGTSMFNHSNVRLPGRVDALLRWIVVTPDMHRVHHSIIPAETNSNFGFNLPWWDRLLGTYKAQPKMGHEGMTIGIEQFRTERDLWLDRMAVQPWRGPASGYPINREE